MSNIKDLILRQIDTEKAIGLRCSSILKTIEPGTLLIDSSKSRDYYSERKNKSVHYLGDHSHPRVRDLIKRYYCKRTKEITDTNVQILERTVEGYRSYLPSDCSLTSPRHISACRRHS